MGLTDERLAEIAEDARRRARADARVLPLAARLKTMAAVQPLHGDFRYVLEVAAEEAGRLTEEQERLREALRRCEYADLTGSTPTCPACGYATPVYHEGELLGGGHAKGCWMREALVGEQDTTTTPNLRNASVSKENQEEA